jgi:hypothetical protein
MKMREELGVMISAKFNLISEDADTRGNIVSDFGINRVPTVEEVQSALEKSIAYFNEALGVEDTRLVTMGDFGFAEPRDMVWPSSRKMD